MKAYRLKDIIKNMKKVYKNCLYVWLIQIVALIILNKLNIQFESLYIHAIGVFVCLLPIVVLFGLMSKDQDFSPQKRNFFKFINGYIIFCYIAGLVANIVFGNN